MDSPIVFHVEDIDFTLDKQPEVIAWLTACAAERDFSVEALNYVFVSDEQLADMNESYLDHDTYTDILTFPLGEPGSKTLMGDIFISVDRVRDNAQEMGIPFQDELHRVIVHGLLHLMGEDDLDDESEAAMRRAEDYALSLRRF